MDNENRRYSNGEQTPPGFPSGTNSLGRPPPGLERNYGYHPNSLKENTSASPPGLGASFAFPVVHPSNNNVFFPPQSPSPVYSFYSPLQTQGYASPFDKGYQGRSEIGGISSNGNYHFPLQNSTPNSSNIFSGTPPRESSSVDPCPGRIESSELVRDTSTTVIEPMIENLMGSMGNSNGTYSHFGPTTSSSIVTGLSFGQASQVRNSSSPITSSMSVGAELNPVINTDPFNSSPEWEFQRKMEAKIRQKQLLQKQQTNSVSLGGFKGNSNTSANSPTPSFAATVRNGAENSIKESNGQIHQEALSTNSSTKLADSSTSPRQTPAKPSYLEILTKNCSTEKKSASKSRKFRDFQEETTKFNGDACPLFQVQNQTHRKHTDSFSSLIGSSSPTASNPSTASSSPIAKPRTQLGKENINGSSDSSSGGSKSSTRRNTPSGTPTHERPPSETRKKVVPPVVTGNACWIKKLSGRAMSGNNNAKNNGKNIGNETSVSGKGISHFEFEIEDIDISEGVGGGRDEDVEIEKSRAQQLTNNEEKNTGSVIKKKDKRRYSANIGTTELGNNNSNGVDRRGSGCESKSSGSSNNTTASMYFTFGGRKNNTGKEKSEKFRTRKEERNCAIRRLRVASKKWITHLMKAVTWLWTLLMNVTVLSFSLGYTLTEDLLSWWKITAFPTFRQKMKLTKQKINSTWKRLMNIVQRKKESPTSPKPESYELLSVLGPERNIALPGTGDEALRRLLSVRGQDPYSILGVRSDSLEETIRRYYKKQAVLVHPDKNLVPGAEEAFKILAKAFEMVGEPGSRLKYHQQLLEAHAKEKFIGEFGELFEELRKKMETACSTIRCTKCKVRHKKNKTTRPLFAARYCAQCRIHHGAREGELWAEKNGMFSFSWQFYACMGNQIWEINEWGRCQRSSLKHLKPNAHNVIYRLVSGGQQGGKSRTFPPGSGTNSSAGSSGPNDEDDLFDPRMEDWDSLINNLYRNSGNVPNHTSNSTTAPKGSSTGPGSVNQNGNGFNSAAAVKKRKGKRK